jgi:hypothetical protein
VPQLLALCFEFADQQQMHTAASGNHCAHPNAASSFLLPGCVRVPAFA